MTRWALAACPCIRASIIIQPTTTMSEQVSAIIPQTKSRHLRACLLCSLIQTSNDFRSIGCPNCEEILQVPKWFIWATSILIAFLQLKDSPDRIVSCTTAYFDGVIAVIDPETSWVARWQRTGTWFMLGLYCFRWEHFSSKICSRHVRRTCQRPSARRCRDRIRKPRNQIPNQRPNRPRLGRHLSPWI